MSPIEAVVAMSSLESDVAPTMEPIVYQKFGEMELHEEEEEDDGDYCPSEADSDDSLEWASETERTMAEDALAEGTVGLDFYGAAVSVATEYVSSYKPVQMGLSMATILPVASIQRAARAARRAGTKNIEGGVDSSPSIITDTINSVLSYLGFSLVPAVEDSSKPVREAPHKDDACSNGILPNSVSTPPPPPSSKRTLCGSTLSLALSPSPLSKSLER